MANRNITPRPENLTRAGKGQPKKHYARKTVTLPPDLIDQIQRYADSKKIKFNAALIEGMRAFLNEKNRHREN